MSSTTEAPPLRNLDPDVVGALEHCRVRTNHNATPEGFRKAKEMGLLAQDPCWRTTQRGEGVLIAAGLLPPQPAAEQLVIHMIWADHGDRYQPTPVAAFSDGMVDALPETYERLRAEAEEQFSFEVDGPHRFFRTVEHIDRPSADREECE